MTSRRHGRHAGKGHRFGGDWTTDKLAVLAGYLRAYTTALKKQPFRKAYIDAFAGTGYRDARPQGAADGAAQGPLFPDLAAAEPQGLLDGSARLALGTDPPFDAYIFIEQREERCEHLRGLGADYPSLADRIRVRQGDANDEIRDLCGKDWSDRRAVLFLDPYGMQVEWSTLEAIASTQSIDLWLLFPLGIGVNRLLTRSGDIPEPWRRRLDILLGTDDWYEELYRVERTPSLFQGAEEQVVKASVEVIGRYFVDRLKSIFPGVAEQPRVLRNSSNCPLYLLCFAVGNPRGVPVALRIADHLLKKGALIWPWARTSSGPLPPGTPSPAARRSARAASTATRNGWRYASRRWGRRTTATASG